MPRKKVENKTTNVKTPKTKKNSKSSNTSKVSKTKTPSKIVKPTPKIATQNTDIENVIRYLKSEHSLEDYNKYLTPLIKSKGKQYVDKLIGSTMIVFEERGYTLDDVAFDENDNLTVVKRK